MVNTQTGGETYGISPEAFFSARQKVKIYCFFSHCFANYPVWKKLQETLDINGNLRIKSIIDKVT